MTYINFGMVIEYGYVCLCVMIWRYGSNNVENKRWIVLPQRPPCPTLHRYAVFYVDSNQLERLRIFESYILLLLYEKTIYFLHHMLLLMHYYKIIWKFTFVIVKYVPRIISFSCRYEYSYL